MADKKRHIDEEYPGMRTNSPEKYPERAQRRDEFTEKLRRHLEDDLGYDETQVEKYLYELRQELGDQTKKIEALNKDIKDLDIDRVQASVGHRHPVSKSINSPANRELQDLPSNRRKKNRYSISPEAQLAVGNPARTDKSKFENWKNDFLVWADRKENGGSGVLPQHRKTHKPRIERHFYQLGGEKYDKKTPKEKLKVRAMVDDMTAKLDDPMRPAHETGTKPDKRWPNPLSEGDRETVAAMQADPHDRKGGIKIRPGRAAAFAAAQVPLWGSLAGSAIGATMDVQDALEEGTKESWINAGMGVGGGLIDLVSAGLLIAPIPGARPASIALDQVAGRLGQAQMLYQYGRMAAESAKQPYIDQLNSTKQFR